MKKNPNLSEGQQAYNTLLAKRMRDVGDFVMQLTHLDPLKRQTARDMLFHKFIMNRIDWLHEGSGDQMQKKTANGTSASAAQESLPQQKVRLRDPNKTREEKTKEYEERKLKASKQLKFQEQLKQKKRDKEKRLDMQSKYLQKHGEKI